MKSETLIPGLSIDKWSTFLIAGSQYHQILDRKFLLQSTVKEILSKPYVFRLEEPTKLYYAANEGVYTHLQEKGKHPLWLHELLEELRLQRYPYDSIYEWPLGKLLTEDTSENFPELSFAILLESPQYGDVWVVSNEQARSQLGDNLPVLLSNEIAFLQKVPPETIKKVFLVKKTWRGARLIHHGGIQ